MENASKALLMAGAVLLLMLVLTFSVYFVKKLGGQTSELYSNIKQSDIDEFNQQFFNYDGKDNLRIHDVISIINLAKNNNQSERFPIIIKVKVDGEEMQDISNDAIKEMLSNQENINAKYSCIVEYGKNKNLVENVTIEKIS